MAQHRIGAGNTRLEHRERTTAAGNCVAARRSVPAGNGFAPVTPRRKRLLLVLAILIGVGTSAALAFMASRDNVMFYFDPSQVAAGKAPHGKRFRVGGMVVKGSVVKADSPIHPGQIDVRFVLTDFQHEVPVRYSGVLPDLFREGQGVIAHGEIDGGGTFIADEVLAKHDEKYMPPEVAGSLKYPHAGGVPSATTGSDKTPP